MSKSWQVIVKEFVDRSQVESHERMHRAFRVFQERQRRSYSERVLWNVQLPDSSGRVSDEDIRACLEEIRKLSDEDLAKIGLRRCEEVADGCLVVVDFALNEDKKGGG